VETLGRVKVPKNALRKVTLKPYNGLNFGDFQIEAFGDFQAEPS
jgi:hypothetical protein